MPKTLFDSLIDDVFLKSSMKYDLPKTTQKFKGDYMYICSNTKEKKHFHYYWEINDHYIFLRKK